MICMPENYQTEVNEVNYTLGLPYDCWLCGNSFVKEDNNHNCTKAVQEESSLVNPYNSNYIEDIYLINSKNKSFSSTKMLEIQHQVNPMNAVFLGLLIEQEDLPKETICHWIDDLGDLSTEIRNNMKSLLLNQPVD